MSVGRAARRWGPALIGLVLLVFGVTCLNYTKPSALEHHRAWSGEHGRPAPSDGMVWGGACAVGIGSFAIGLGTAGLIGGRPG